jgi:hypothetical protein
MLQIELRVNGVLIDYVDAVNTCHLIECEDGEPVVFAYEVTHGKEKRIVSHTRDQGAIKLAAIALEALVNEETT